MLPDITKTSPKDWSYVSEGGATIVFSYIGEDPEFHRTVIRLRKATVTNLQPAELLEDGHEDEDPSICFQRECMQRLVPTVHLPRLEACTLSRGWLEDFERFHTDERPVSRQAEGGIDLTKKKGVLATDLVGGRGIAVEIKPKWSFLPNTSYLSGTKQVIKSRTCRYCMHSSMKSLNGTSYTVKYCPLDLFSSDHTRVRNAIHALYDAWVESEGKVNNLKIFVGGRKIGVNERKSMLSDPSEPISDLDLRELFTSSLFPLLTQTPVLRILNRLQRTLDILDIGGLSKLWNQSHDSSPSILGAGLPDPTLAEWSDFIGYYVSSQGRFDPKTTDLRHYILAYLLSATFKDCSIMVRMSLLVGGGAETETGSEVTIEPGNVKVIDLDPKSINKLSKWEKLDEQIVAAYQNVEEVERRHCVDDYDMELDGDGEMFMSPTSWDGH